MKEARPKIDPTMLDLKDTVVSINRVTKVVKGGKNLSFSALVVVGDGAGHCGFAIGKAKEVPSAIKKGIEAAKKALIRVPLQGTTIPHAIIGTVWRRSRTAEAGPAGHRDHRRRRRPRGPRGHRHPRHPDEVTRHPTTRTTSCARRSPVSPSSRILWTSPGFVGSRLNRWGV